LAITVVTANEGSNENSGNNPASLVLSVTHTLANASGSDRLVIMAFTATEVNNGTAPIGIDSGPTYNSAAPTNNTTNVGDDSGAHNGMIQIAWWDDAALPPSASDYTATVTITATSGRIAGGLYVVEMTGVDQTTPIASNGTNTAFGTGTQSSATLLSAAGNVQWSIISGGMNAGAGDVTTTSDNEQIDSVVASGGNRMNWAVGYASDGTITQAKSADHTSDQVAMIGINEAAASITGGVLFYAQDKLRLR
jgi:hypothetical protein